ncbi:MAG TPA: glutamine amidotransferase [Alphaproteobacteria bacterium]|nr:glutamine amidotransferase [Alphaproteobacteria bacterium]
MKTLILCHKSQRDAGAFEKMLKQRGADIELRLAYEDGVKDTDPLAHDLTIFMGGPMGVYQADLFPYLRDEISYIEKRLQAEKPYLGICLGGQLMAAAMGSEVYPGKQGKEVGWQSIHVNDNGKNTPMMHLDASNTRMMQWHGDTFDLPKEAVLLASSDLYQNQAIAYGQKALGLQCHPEVTRTNIELWLALGISELKEVGLDVPTLREQTIKNIDTLDKQRTKFFNEWLDSVEL